MKKELINKGIKKNKLSKNRNITYQLRWNSKSDINKITDFIYEDSDLYLERKWKI